MEETRDLNVQGEGVELAEVDTVNNEEFDGDGSQGALMENQPTGQRRKFSRKSKISFTLLMMLAICILGAMVYALMAYKEKTEIQGSTTPLPTSTTPAQPKVKVTTERPYILPCDTMYDNVTKKEILKQTSQFATKKKCSYRTYRSNFMECVGNSDSSSIRMKTETRKMILLPLSKEIYLANEGPITFTLIDNVSCILIRHSVRDVFKRHSAKETCNYSKDPWILGGRKRRESDTPGEMFDGNGDELTDMRMTGRSGMSSIKWSTNAKPKPTALAPDDPDEDYDYYDKFITKIPEYSRYQIDQYLEYFELC